MEDAGPARVSVFAVRQGVHRAHSRHGRFGRDARTGQGRGRRLAAVRMPDAGVLVASSAQPFPVGMVERSARRFGDVALTLVAMATSGACFLVIALARGDLPLPHGWTVWGALVVTGVFASAFAVLIQVWAQRRMSAARIALVFALAKIGRASW